MTYTLYNTVKGGKVSTSNLDTVTSTRTNCIKRNESTLGFNYDIMGRHVHPNTVNKRTAECADPILAISQENEMNRPHSKEGQTDFRSKINVKKAKYPKINASFFNYSSDMKESQSLKPSSDSKFAHPLHSAPHLTYALPNVPLRKGGAVGFATLPQPPTDEDSNANPIL